MQTSSSVAQAAGRDFALPSETRGPDQASQSRVEARLRTAKALFVLAAAVSFLFSVYLWFLVDREQGLFVGLWVPSILALGSLLLSGRGGRQ